jgi:hypothetical protein
MTTRVDRPTPLAEAAYVGLPGEFVRTIEPHSEADPAALLITLLVLFGNVIGRSAHVNGGGSNHRANLFAALVGATSMGRKGTAQRAIARQFDGIDPLWASERMKSGLSSGEGIIFAVRDAIWIKHAKRNDKQEIEEYYSEMIDEGVVDKRLMVVQEEFGAVLRMFEREGNILSNVIRSGWDGDSLETMTKNPLKATAPHISIIGHISKEELLRRINNIESANGFGNRYLWAWVERSKFLPHGGSPDGGRLAELCQQLERAVEFGNTAGGTGWDSDASALWEAEYRRLSTPAPGLMGSMTARAAPIVLRLSLIYSLLNRSECISESHLRAALEVWRYCEESAKFIFGERLGDVTADRILHALRAGGELGITRTDISSALRRNTPAHEIERALSVLDAAGLAEMQVEPTTGGRPVERWFATAHEGSGIAS